MSDSDIINQILDQLESMNNMDPYCERTNFCMHCTFKEGKLAHIQELRKKLPSSGNKI